MRMRGKVAVLLALAGFVGCITGSAIWAASMSCCAKTCEPCPILLSKTTVPGSPEKVDVLHALLPAAFPLVRQAAAAIHGRSLAQIPTFLPHEFRRPMRN